MNQHTEPQLTHYAAHTCPHCPGLRGTCCQCNGTRLIRMPAKVIAAVAFAWARGGCRCDATPRSWPVGQVGPQGDPTA
jgi:hypothetical protein